MQCRYKMGAWERKTFINLCRHPPLVMLLPDLGVLYQEETVISKLETSVWMCFKTRHFWKPNQRRLREKNLYQFMQASTVSNAVAGFRTTTPRGNCNHQFRGFSNKAFLKALFLKDLEISLCRYLFLVMMLADLGLLYNEKTVI